MQTVTKGTLISIEGIDGCGKTTLAHNLAQALSAMNLPVILTKEPGGTGLGTQLRSLVQEKKVAIGPKAEFLLFAADRAQHFNELIVPQLQLNKIIISDRMADSSLAYQGFGRGINLDSIKTINKFVMNGIEPDLTLYVRTSAQTAATRIAQRKQALTSFEKEKIDFMNKVVAGFDEIFKNRENCMTIDGEQSIETITNQALAHVTQWMIKKQILK